MDSLNKSRMFREKKRETENSKLADTQTRQYNKKLVRMIELAHPRFLTNRDVIEQFVTAKGGLQF